MTMFARTAPAIALTVHASAETMAELFELLAAISAAVDDPDRVAAIRLDEDACCAEVDIAARPVDPRRLN